MCKLDKYIALSVELESNHREAANLVASLRKQVVLRKLMGIPMDVKCRFDRHRLNPSVIEARARDGTLLGAIRRDKIPKEVRI